MPTPTARRNRKLSNIAAAVVIVALCVVTVRQQSIISNNHKLAVEGAKAHDVLCTQRTNTAARVQRQTTFLHHPEMFPELEAFNTPQLRKFTRLGLVEDKAELAVSSELDCEE